jgi:hypothetical protein
MLFAGTIAAASHALPSKRAIAISGINTLPNAAIFTFLLLMNAPAVLAY